MVPPFLMRRCALASQMCCGRDQAAPRVVVTLGWRAHQLLRDALAQAGKAPSVDVAAKERVRIAATACRVVAYKVIGGGHLRGTIVVKCPQHRARIFRAEDARRCAAGVRSIIEHIGAL